MKMLLTYKKLRWYQWLLFGAFVLSAPLFLKGQAAAAPPNFEAYCGTPANTIGALYSNASNLSSTDGTATITVYAQAHICNKAPPGYNVVDLHIVWYSSTGTGGTTGSMSPSSRNFAMGNWAGAGTTTTAIPQTVNLSGLRNGSNCWNLNYSMNGLYGGVRDDSGPGFFWNMCVNYTLINPNVPPNTSNFTADCNTASVDVTTQNNHTYNAWLVVNGVQTSLTDFNNASGSPATINVSSYKDFSTRDYQIRVQDTVNLLSTITSVRTRGPCLQFACGSATSVPGNPEPGQPFQLTVSFNVVNVSGGAPSSIGSNGTAKPWFIRLRVSPGVLEPAQVVGSGNLTSGVGTITGQRSGLTAPSIGPYSGAWTVSTTAISPPFIPPGVCNDADAVTVVFNPFFKVLGGDVAAGITTAAPGCPGWGQGGTPPGGGRLSSWNNRTAGAGNEGAGTNLAAFARGTITDFASAQGPLAGSPSGLTFSNTVVWPPALMGGSLADGIIPCPTDYYATLPAGTTTVAGSISPNSIGNSARYAPGGSLTVTTTGFIPVGLLTPGARPIIYVNGDAYISGGITLASGATTVAGMPNFYLVAKGNIYIAPNVTRLDGVYVAQPDASGNRGRIYTCAFPDVAGVSWRAPTGAELNGACKTNVLNVFGAFIAKELKLYRSFGTLNTNTPAEIFNITPATWLAVPCAIAGSASCGPTTTPPYDAITSLPPIL